MAIRRGKKKPKPKPKPKPSYAWSTPFGDDVQEAQDAFDQASQDYIAAVEGGDPATIRTAHLELLIAIANYIRVVGAEPEPVPPE